MRLFPGCVVVLGSVLACSCTCKAGEVPGVTHEGGPLAYELWPNTMPVLDARFDINYQDCRSNLSIQHALAHWLEDPSHFVLLGDPEDAGPVMACYAPGSNPTPEEMAALQAAMIGFESRYQLGSRWGSGTNTPFAITWSFVPDGVSIPGGVVPGEVTAPSNLFAQMDSKFGGNRALWISRFEQSFARWGEVMGITYTRITVGGNDWDDGAAWGSGSAAGLRGHVRIGMHALDGASNVLAYNSFPTNGDMVIDSAENWGSSTNNHRFLRNTIMHEHGHGIGMAHVDPINSTKLMEAFLNTNFDGPQQDDIRGAQEYYGDFNEPNGATTTATSLGTLTPGVTITLGNLSTAAPNSNPAPANTSTIGIINNDVDMYSLVGDAPRLYNIVAQPIGSTYLQGPQGGSTANTNALAMADLELSVLAGNGTTVYYTGNSGAIGVNESVSGVLIPQGQNYIRVTEVGTPADTQLYKLSVTPLTTSIAPSATDATFTDKVRITWPVIPNVTTYELYRNTLNSIAGATQIFTSPSATLFDDTTAVPGTQYYYYLRVEQFANGNFRYTVANGSGEPGSRGIPPNVPPTANAGPDQTLTDNDNNGSEPVTLNGSASFDPDGTIVSYQWQNGAVNLGGPGPSPTLNTTLAVGVHTIVLTVVDNSGAPATDTVIITVNAGAPSGCDTIDFNGDSLFPDSADLDDFLSVFGGGTCSTGTCGDIDFNNDGLFPDSLDIDSLLSVFGGGPCL